jgi:DNA-binding SARP family transcriptional activator
VRDPAMKRDQLAFLFGGLAFGLVAGFGLFRTIATRPTDVPERGGGGVPSVAGPSAPTDIAMGGGAGAPAAAPMLAQINELKERVQKDPKDFEAWTRLGNLYQDAGMMQPAISFYEKASALKPDDANVLTDMGICYQQQSQYDKSLELFERAQKADASNWQSLYNIVVVAGLRMGRVDRAEAALTRLQQLKPDAPNLADLKAALDRVKGSGTPGTR